MVKGMPLIEIVAPSERPRKVPTIGAVLVMIGNVSPGVGVKLFIATWSWLPVSVAVPLTTSWVKPVPGFASLMVMTKFELVSSVTLPWAVRLPRPYPTVPEDVMGPTVPEPPNVPLMSFTGLAGCEPSTSR